MKHRTIRGEIEYTSRKPDRLGANRGRERFAISVHGNGDRTLSAHCEIDDPPSVMRDVTMSLDGRWRPLDCFVRLCIDDTFEGSGWMRFTDGFAECESLNVRDGRLSQRIELGERVRWLGAHPIVGDGMAFAIYDTVANGSGKRFFDNVMLTSPDHRGATGPMLFELGIGIEYVADERITVAAGEFDAHHFRFVDTDGQLPEEHPPYDVWCSADGDFIFLKGEVGGYMQTYYELTRLSKE